jgi:GxxExxY protein
MLVAMTGRTTDLDRLSSQVIQASIAVHRALGPGLLESAYQKCMAIELRQMGLDVRTEVPVAIHYREQQIAEEGFRMDLLVEDVLIVELKSVEDLKPLHGKQLLTYLRLARKPLGLLINFNVPVLKDGIHRVINSAKADLSA